MRFSKMHGLGNDFMIVDSITQNISFSSEIIRYLADRHYGVGFDQLLVVEHSSDPSVDFYYRIFNADGREVNQCGNGARCFARFVYMKELTNKLSIRVSTHTKSMVLFLIGGDEVCVDMGEPIFDPVKIPFLFHQIRDCYLISVGDQKISCGVVSVGNPHCVLMVQNIESAQVDVLGPILENHYCFPDQVNVSFMEIISCKHVRMRVHERGVGETQSCGSAACAAASIGIKQGLLYNPVRVDLLGGSLIINWRGLGYPLYMYGSATHVYDGCIYL